MDDIFYIRNCPRKIIKNWLNLFAIKKKHNTLGSLRAEYQLGETLHETNHFSQEGSDSVFVSSVVKLVQQIWSTQSRGRTEIFVCSFCHLNLATRSFVFITYAPHELLPHSAVNIKKDVYIAEELGVNLLSFFILLLFPTIASRADLWFFQIYTAVHIILDCKVVKSLQKPCNFAVFLTF